jgi:hypothetical protein
LSQEYCIRLAASVEGNCCSVSTASGSSNSIDSDARLVCLRGEQMQRPTAFVIVKEESAPDGARTASLDDRTQAANQLGIPVEHVRYVVATALPDFPLAREYRKWWAQQSDRGKAGLVLQTQAEFSAEHSRDGTALALRTLITRGHPAHWTRVYFDARNC